MDGTGTISRVVRDQNAVVFEIILEDKQLLKYIIPKGSITLDGISLTVVDIREAAFTVSIIPHTLSETALAYKKSGDRLNIECDVLGKYVDRLLHYGTSQAAGDTRNEGGIGQDFLNNHGFV